MMTPREKLINSLNHQDGPMPMDLGSTPVSGMHCSCVAALRDYYGLEKRPVKIHESFQMLGWIDADLQEAIGSDAVAVEPLSTMFGFAVEGWKEWTTPWGQDVLVPGLFNVTQADRDIYIYPEGDLNAAPSGHMPDGSYFFDTIIRQGEIDEDHLNPDDNLEEFCLLSDDELERLRVSAENAAASGRAVIGTTAGTSLGDIAIVPAPFLKEPRGIRDIEEWYVSTVIRQDYIHEVFERQTEIAVVNLERMNAAVGDLLDVVLICGTDFGTQSSTFCSPDTFNELWKPYYRKINDWIHENTTWKTFKHSCGAVEGFMSHFIDAGFDIINPVQCSATGMDPQTLKDRYGDQLVFWGGGVDTQQTLPFGTPDEVRQQVAERCRIFSQNGGFVFNAIHNVQACTPVENIVAMIDAVRDFNS